MKKKKDENNKNKIKTIIILMGSGIGDIISYTPILRKLKKEFNANITILTKKSNVAFLFKKCPYLDHFIQIGLSLSFFKKLQLIKKLRSKKYDLLIKVFPGTKMTTLLAYLIRAKQKIGYNFHNLLFYKKSYKCKNITEQELDILKKIGININKNDNALEWFFNIKHKKIKKILKKNNISKKDFLIGFHLGAREDCSARFWPAEKWAKAINCLLENYNAKIVFIGGKNDIEETQKVIELIRQPISIVNFVNKLSLEETASLINECALFISTNAGPMHIAASLHKPQIALCGPSIREWEPHNDKAIVVRKIIGRKHCNPPCDAKKCKYRDNLCMNVLTVENVLNATRKQLKNVEEKNVK